MTVHTSGLLKGSEETCLKCLGEWLGWSSSQNVTLLYGLFGNGLDLQFRRVIIYRVAQAGFPLVI